MPVMMTAAEANQLRRRRRVSTSFAGHRPYCRSLPYALEALDLSAASPIPSLVTLRVHVLSYLADLEARLALLDQPTESTPEPESHTALDDVREWARDGLEMLHRIRTECEAYLPTLHMDDLSVESMRSALPDLPDVRSHFPELPNVRLHIPDMADVRAYLPDLPETPTLDLHERLTAARKSLSDLDFRQPLSYLPTLSNHLQSLQKHLSDVHFPTHQDVPLIAPSQIVSDLLDRLLASDFASHLTLEAKEDDNVLERTAKDLARAMKTSMHGAKLIAYHDLPHAWRNNHFVKSGYR